jgi:hypothetical protein
MPPFPGEGPLPHSNLSPAKPLYAMLLVASRSTIVELTAAYLHIAN